MDAERSRSNGGARTFSRKQEGLKELFSGTKRAVETIEMQTTVGSTQLRDSLMEVLSGVELLNKRVVVTHRKKEIAAIIPIRQLRILEAIEQEDHRAFEVNLAELESDSENNFVPMIKVLDMLRKD